MSGDYVNAALPTAEQLMDGIARALKALDFEAAVALLRVLAVVDPASAETICQAIEALPAVAGSGFEPPTSGL